MILSFKGKQPQIDASVFIAPDALVSGDVEINEFASIFFGAKLRGDIQKIHVGARSNIQDNAVVHTSRGRLPCVIESDVSVGHAAILHGCRVCEGSLIGMGAIVLDDAVIPQNCLVGAGALVTEGKTFSEGSLILGSPAREVRKLTSEEVKGLRETSKHYVTVARDYLAVVK